MRKRIENREKGIGKREKSSLYNLQFRRHPLFSSSYSLSTSRGLSLAEFIIYFAIISVIFTITLQLIAQMLRISERNRVIQEVQENVRFATNSFSQIVHNAKSVCQPASSGAIAEVRNISNSDCGTTEISNHTIFKLVPNDVGVDNEFRVCDNQTVNNCSADTNFVAVTSGRVTITSLDFTKYVFNGKASSLQMKIKIKYKNPNNNPLFDYSLEAKIDASLQK